MSSLLHKPPILHGLIPSFSQGSPSAGDGWTAGNTLIFDGLNDSIDLASAIPLAGDFTLSMWFNTTTAAQIFLSAAIANKYIAIESATVVTVFLGSYKTYTVPAMSGWNHLFIVRDGVTTTVYLNGVDEGGQAAGTNNADFDRIGRFHDNTFYMDGKMDDLYIWDSVIGTLQNSVDIYNGGTPVDPESVIADATYKYLFNESTGTNLPDTGAGANNGTLTNFADPDANWVSRL